MDDNDIPIDFEKLTQKDIDKANKYKTDKDYDTMDVLNAIVENEKE